MRIGPDGPELASPFVLAPLAGIEFPDDMKFPERLKGA